MIHQATAKMTTVAKPFYWLQHLVLILPELGIPLGSHMRFPGVSVMLWSNKIQQLEVYVED